MTAMSLIIPNGNYFLLIIQQRAEKIILRLED